DQNDPFRHMTIDVAMLMSGGVTRKHDIVPIRHARGTEISLLGAITDAHPFTFLVDPAPPRLGVTALLPHIEHGEHAVGRGIDSPHAHLDRTIKQPAAYEPCSRGSLCGYQACPTHCSSSARRNAAGRSATRAPRTSASAGTSQSKDCPIAWGTRALRIGRSVGSAAAAERRDDSFNHFVRGNEQCLRYSEAERFCGLEIDA